MNAKLVVAIGGALLLVVLGFALGRVGGDSNPTHDAHGEAAQTSTMWTCSMHPQIQLPKPGKCPICFMDLIPVSSGGQDDGEGPTLTMSAAAMKLAEVQTSRVVRRHSERPVRLVGKLNYDETRRRQITAWVGGRLDRLYVDFEGISIRKGDHLASIYSPELVSAQEELLQAVNASRELAASDLSLLRDSAQATVEASREKLRLLGLSPRQIASVVEKQTVEDHVTIFAPMDGIVLTKHALEGGYVETGTVIYEIADLSRVWLMLDAYEKDLAWLQYGQDVRFEVEAMPGQSFDGRVVFVDPILDARTRTATVRVNVDNENLLLKPGMFAHATVVAQVGADGRVAGPDLSGKWVSPMHPEIIKDRSGSCDVCGMALVRIEELGLAGNQASVSMPLLIPASAPLITGKRAVVYVKVPGTDRPTFEGREVVLGPRAGDEYVVLDGLTESEEIVTNGAFKIDSAMQIRAKPSMMQPEGGASSTGHHHGGSPPTSPSVAPATEHEDHSGHSQTRRPSPGAFREQLDKVVNQYLTMTRALASDDVTAAAEAAAGVGASLDSVDMSLLDPDAHDAWMAILKDLAPAANELRKGKDLAALRQELAPITTSLAEAVRVFGTSRPRELYRYHCPMAFDNQGADWLLDDKKVRNPYFGDAMLRCGSQVEVLAQGEGEDR